MQGTYFAQYYGHPMMGYDSWSWGSMLFIWAALLVVGTLLAVRLLNRDRDADRTKPTETPLEIIRARYAKGELTKAQFVEMKKDLLAE